MECHLFAILLATLWPTQDLLADARFTAPSPRHLVAILSAILWSTQGLVADTRFTPPSPRYLVAILLAILWPTQDLVADTRFPATFPREKPIFTVPSPRSPIFTAPLPRDSPQHRRNANIHFFCKQENGKVKKLGLWSQKCEHNLGCNIPKNIKEFILWDPKMY